MEALEWERAADWNAAPREDWEVDGEKAGTSQVAEPLTFVTVDDAGHMVGIPTPVRPQSAFEQDVPAFPMELEMRKLSQRVLREAGPRAGVSARA